MVLRLLTSYPQIPRSPCGFLFVASPGSGSFAGGLGRSSHCGESPCSTNRLSFVRRPDSASGQHSLRSRGTRSVAGSVLPFGFRRKSSHSLAPFPLRSLALLGKIPPLPTPLAPTSVVARLRRGWPQRGIQRSVCLPPQRGFRQTRNCSTLRLVAGQSNQSPSIPSGFPRIPQWIVDSVKELRYPGTVWRPCVSAPL
jgi:hypothetical protein